MVSRHGFKHATGLRNLAACGVVAMLSGCNGLGSPPEGAEGAPKPEWAIRVAEMSERVNQVEQSQRAVLSEINNRLSLLEKQMGSLQGNIEELRHENKNLTERLDLLPPPEPKSAHPAPTALATEPAQETPAAETAKPAAPVAAIPPATTAPPAAPAVAPPPAAAPPPPVIKSSTPVAPPKDAYEAAFLLLKQNKFEESLTAFQNYLKASPKDKMADNAQYWIGELHYAQRRFPEALMAFNQVLLRWPTSSKVPDSLLKIGFAFYELNDMENANNSLLRLVKDFPNSSSATVAKPRLALIKQKLGR
ncbi:MAG: tol-pal system protein YbgF [Magnetococcales bacterium]|nr:tol-pal system protein YbgF [Magnetococcales bacterium]